MKFPGIDLGISLQVLVKASFRLGGYGCGFINGCGSVMWNTITEIWPCLLIVLCF